MSHDIRTPMNAIVGMTAIASANIDKPEQVKTCLQKITLSSRHLLGLINDVLDMSKIESGKLNLNTELVSLRETMESLVSIVQPQVKAKGQSFNISVQHISSEQVLCDGVRLNQILINLLSNAVKFTPEGGSISVAVTQELSPRGEKWVRTHFRVKDNGMGMTPEFQKKIFESFAREDTRRVRKIEGSGLGMAITKYIVDKMEGTIEVQSKLEKGSEFHVTLDFEKAEVPEEEMSLPAWICWWWTMMNSFAGMWCIPWTNLAFTPNTHWTERPRCGWRKSGIEKAGVITLFFWTGRCRESAAWRQQRKCGGRSESYSDSADLGLRLV